MVEVKFIEIGEDKYYYADGTPIDKGYWKAHEEAVKLNREQFYKTA